MTLEGFELEKHKLKLSLVDDCKEIEMKKSLVCMDCAFPDNDLFSLFHLRNLQLLSVTERK